MAFRRSSYSINNGTCVEVGDVAGGVLVRDSKDIAGPTLGFTNAAWSGFLTGIKRGELS